MALRPLRVELMRQERPWSTWEAKLCAVQGAALDVDPGVLNIHAGSRVVHLPGLNGKPDQDLSWMMAGHKVNEQANHQGEFGGFLPQAAIKFALPTTDPSYNDVMTASRQCYQGLVTLIRRSHAGFWSQPHCHLRDPLSYLQDRYQLSAEGLLFLTSALIWINNVACCQVPLASLQAYVWPSAATPPHNKNNKQYIFPN